MKVKILILICFFVVLIAGCSGQSGGGTPQPMGTNAPTTPPVNMTNFTGDSEDKQFMQWVSITNKEIMTDIQPIMVSAQNKNWTKLESSGFELKNDSKQLLSKMDDYNISGDMVEVREKYRKSLEAFKLSGETFESAAKNNDSEELSTAYSHMKNATAYLDNASSLLQEKFHSLHTGSMGQMT